MDWWPVDSKNSQWKKEYRIDYLNVNKNKFMFSPKTPEAGL